MLELSLILSMVTQVHYTLFYKHVKKMRGY
ncbi:hypothetical protein SPSF3K_00014 [Streptococcus parauberis]|uniref:Uncharacterized protein n=1 Tax=Streptococcus parauberis TaxID=1348 RepID=A0A2I8AHB0_9STRE|nr:hypothetical protein SPSF3K_00014 [Streptococcus parauberis]KYP21570.1 hypothetical protein AKL14_00480 [Streptococcus parauberis]KYP21746.1 hypothetical protein AKL13_00245 [Streptococcus parauberis]KYP22036.1 hypothetical protein TN39_00286 [Streptococcus parauberis]KYP23640.1 hypothetical protein ADO04_01515 [Streptococcus parauberis]